MKIILFLVCLCLFGFIKAQPLINSQLNDAGIRLYLELKKNNSEENIFISPYAISNALAMCYAGSTAETKEQMHNTLFFSNSIQQNNKLFQNIGMLLQQTDSNNTLTIANALWIDDAYEMKDSFNLILTQYFNSNTAQLSYKTAQSRKMAANTINDWVNKNTENNIHEIINEQALNEQSKIVVTNAVYFKGIWQHPFDKEKSRKGNFTSITNENSTIPFMRTQAQFAFFEDEEYKILALPYANNQFSFWAILPQREYTIQQLEASLDYTLLKQLMQNTRKQKVDVAIPIFSTSYNTELKNTFISLGMPLPFSDQANFSGINDKNELKIDEIYHESFFKIDEQGSEAAAATAVVINTKSAMLNQKNFIANKPFLYYIVENETGLIIFLGRKVKP